MLYHPSFKVTSLLLHALSLLFLTALGDHPSSSSSSSSGFVVVPIGVLGGVDQSNLSAYALASQDDTTSFVMLDVGTLWKGIAVAERKGNLNAFVPSSIPSGVPRVNYFLKYRIKHYLVSHAHMDHIDGLVINSVEDIPPKLIVGSNTTLNYIAGNVFNFLIWPDFGPQGLKTYNYKPLLPQSPFSLPNTSLVVTTFVLRHSYPYLSTAFLVQNKVGQFALYFGDLGPDSVENQKSTPLLLDTNLIVWKYIAPLVANKTLLGLFIECSYADPRAASLLFGHLSPKYVAEELQVLENEVKNLTKKNKPLTGLNVYITHIKPLLNGTDVSEVIQGQLQALNTFGVNFRYPQQGETFYMEPEKHADEGQHRSKRNLFTVHKF